MRDLSIDRASLEFRECTGEGYMPLIDYGAWRIAVLRHADDPRAHNITVEKPDHVSEGIRSAIVDGQEIARQIVPVFDTAAPTTFMSSWAKNSEKSTFPENCVNKTAPPRMEPTDEAKHSLRGG